MDGWMDGWLDGWMDGWMTDLQVVGCGDALCMTAGNVAGGSAGSWVASRRLLHFHAHLLCDQNILAGPPIQHCNKTVLLSRKAQLPQRRLYAGVRLKYSMAS